MSRVRKFAIAAIGTLLTVEVAYTQSAPDVRLFERPGEQLQDSLVKLAIEAEIFSALESGGDPLHPPTTYKGRDESAGGRTVSGWAASNLIFLKLDPALGHESVKDLLIEHDFELEESFPEFGTISVRADLSDYYRDGLSTGDFLSATAEIIGRYGDDSRILSVSPEVGVAPDTEIELDSDGLNSLDKAVPLVGLAAGEGQDWGIADIEAHKIWPRFEVPVQRIVAIFDTGFGLHEDIPFINGVDENRRQSHGNHVAGIMCGIHNEKGFKGVLQFCGVHAQPHGLLVDPSEPGITNKRISLMHSVMDTFAKFVRENDDVAIYNVSLGYNWYQLGKGDPDFDFASNPHLRALVEAQARFLYQALAEADKKNVAIVSAAGNDSRGLDQAFPAKWASPFNYAALTACETRGLCNGIVVEAHDKNGRRAVFSNSGGHVSCPGVNILSAVASDETDKVSHKSYGAMSGTSMAAPYCAAGIVLLSTILKDKPVSELMECLTSSAPRTDFGVPMMKLESALEACE